MPTARLSDRGQTHEDHFFRNLDRERTREADETRVRDLLRTETGIDNDSILDALRAVGFVRGTLPAVEWIPLVIVAWADGDVAVQERDAILRAVEAEGIPESHPAHSLVRSWLEVRPAASLFATWTAYVMAITAGEPGAARIERDERLRRQTRAVAEAAGGWLGFGRISSVEAAQMLEIARVLHAARTS